MNKVIVEVKVPMLAESVADATLISWHKKAGDVVKRGDSLIDIETDKVTLEVAAPNNGVLSEILKQDGDDVSSDEIIALINTGSKSEPAAAKTAPAEKTETSPEASASSVPEQQSLPVLDEAQVIDDDPIESEQPEASTDESVEEENDPDDSVPTIDEISAEESHDNNSPKLSPAVRNLIDNHNLNVHEIKHETDTDRITKEDVLQHIGETQNQTASMFEETESSGVRVEKETPAPAATQTIRKETTPAPVVEKAPSVEKQAPVTPTPIAASEDEGRPEQRVAMTRLRQRVAERLLSAQQENAILTTFNEVNMQPVMDLRARYKEEFENTHGVKLGFMSFFCKAAVEALKKFPIINASVEGKEIIYHEYYDLGIAVSSPRGLVVPVLRDVDLLSLSDIEISIREFGDKAREGTLELEDLIGGTFTITNGGVFGSLLSTPIINPPQSAILGMHKIEQRPIAEDGQVVIRPMMYLAMSYDHRIIDGRDAVQFLVTVKEQLEDPARLLLQI